MNHDNRNDAHPRPGVREATLKQAEQAEWADLQRTWQQASLDLAATSIPQTTHQLDDLKTSAAKFETTIRRRNLREIVAAAMVAVPFAVVGVFCWTVGKPLASLGCAIVVLSAAAIVAILRRWGRVDLGGDLGLSTEAFRARLARSKLDQARLLRAAPLWYVFPLYVGVVLLGLGLRRDGEPPWLMWSYLTFQTVFFAAIAGLNLWAARRLRQEAASLQTSTPTMVVAVILAGLTGCATPQSAPIPSTSSDPAATANAKTPAASASSGDASRSPGDDSRAPAVATSIVGPDLERARAAHEVPAMGAAIVRSNGLVVMDVSGVRRRRRGGAVTADERWHLGSNTKAMTATLVAILVEEATDVDWERSVADLFPDLEVDPAWREVTLQMLVDHRSGLASDLGTSTMLASRAGLDPRAHRASWVEATLASPPPETPGTFAYSNLGYIALGALLERRMDAPFEQLLRERVWQPLGMHGCGFGGPGEDNARGHVGGVAQGAYFDNPPILAPAATVHCTLESWVPFVTMHLRAARGEDDPQALLRPASFERLHTAHDGGAYAGGWIVGEVDDGHPYLAHDGSNTAWLARVMIVPALDTALLITSNAGPLESQGAIDAITMSLLAHARDTPWP